MAPPQSMAEVVKGHDVSSITMTPQSTVESVKTHAVPVEVRRSDYKESPFLVKHVELELELDFEKTKVKTILSLCRNSSSTGAAVSAVRPDLSLDGANTITIESIRLQSSTDADKEGQILRNGEHYKISSDYSMIIKGDLLPERQNEMFKIIMISHVNPTANTDLSGLYKTGPMLCTQMEAEGFRRMTYGIDRPDVSSTFKVRLEADKSKFSVLLSNGNQIESGDLPNGRHYVVFEDPFPKPSYLFGIVAGNLISKEDSFIRQVGKPVRLSLWCESKDADKFDWALESLKKAMKWDEDQFGRVYDLDWFNIVAVSYFNMGAMENKSLNIFNAARVLAHKRISTDEEFTGVLSCVAHEYFHNWTGNRVSCRDWFQLTLKEGLTVYRHQEFTRDMGNRSVQRIKDVLAVRSEQFREDAGPLAHPVRPESYQQIDNFYTATVYCKGAEVVRMYEKILGKEGFRKGMDLYFQRHDGKSVTCDDFRAAMSDANKVDFSQFERWYCQSGTPTVTVEPLHYNPSDKTFTITMKQSCNSGVQCKKQQTAESNKPYHIPVVVGLIGRGSHKELMTTTLQFTEEKQVFTLKDVAEEPVLSIFRDFCAPVKVVIPSMTDADYGILMSFDTDGFNRWEAGQKLMRKAILERATKHRDSPNEAATFTKSTPTLDVVLSKFRQMMTEATVAVTGASSASLRDLYFKSFALLVPCVSSLMTDFIPCNPISLHTARIEIMKFIGKHLENEFKGMYECLTKLISSRAFDLSVESMGIRSLRNRLLSYLTIAKDHTELAIQHYKSADNMTDRIAALSLLVNYPKEESTKHAIAEFVSKTEEGCCSALQFDKWFCTQAGADHDSVLDCVKQLKKHQFFTPDNIDVLQSFIIAFARNPRFHCVDGQGYKFVADAVAEIDKMNPSLAASVAKHLTPWKTMDGERQVLIKAELSKLARLDLSGRCRDIVVKSLD